MPIVQSDPIKTTVNTKLKGTLAIKYKEFYKGKQVFTGPQDVLAILKRTPLSLETLYIKGLEVHACFNIPTEKGPESFDLIVGYIDRKYSTLLTSGDYFTDLTSFQITGGDVVLNEETKQYLKKYYGLNVQILFTKRENVQF